jgi:hypothetical protein
MTQPIFVAANFADVEARRPFIGYPGNVVPVIPNSGDPVKLTLSDGTVPTIFDTKDTALRCMEQMRQNAQWLLTPTDDIMIIAVSYTKLLIAESSLINQKLFASFLPIYFGGQLRFIHRSMSAAMRLSEALQDVGFFVQDPLTNNYELANAHRLPHITIVDINYKATTTQADAGSFLDDGVNTINYNYSF